MLLREWLAGCGRHTYSGLVPVSGTPNSVSGHRTFKFTGTKQIFEVPYGVTQIRVIALGANGAGSGKTGYGGRVSAAIPVTYLEDLVVVVGGDASGPGGGFNGGGNGGDKFSSNGNGGGGASDVREGGDKVSDRVLVAGGGGGAGGGSGSCISFCHPGAGWWRRRPHGR